MQRLGFLKCIVANATPSESQTLQSLTHKFESTITRPTELAAEMADRFCQYVSRFQLHKRYPKIPPGSVELQDAYLSDPQLPSGSGAITGELERAGYRHAVYVEIPAWAVRIRVVRANNYSLTDRGKLLRFIGPGHQWDHFDVLDNPFLVPPAQAFIFLFCLIDADGDLLRLVYRRMLDRSPDTFDRGEIGRAAAEGLREFIRSRMHQSSGNTAQLLLRAKKTIDAIESQHSSAYGPRESVATPRVEPLVDCGWLRKPDPASYVYQFTEVGKQALTALAESNSVSAFLTRDLPRLISPLPEFENPPSLSWVREAYDDMKSGLGYVSIRELVLASLAKRLAAGQPVCSISALEEVLLRAPSKYGPVVRLAQGRSGGLAQVRIHPEAFRQDHDG